MSRYKWVWADQPGGERLFSVGVLDDGSLHNPNGYPEDAVRAAVMAADARCHELRSEAAKKAATTRRRRQEKRVNEIAAQWAQGRRFGPGEHCVICHKGLGDPASI